MRRIRREIEVELREAAGSFPARGAR